MSTIPPSVSQPFDISSGVSEKGAPIKEAIWTTPNGKAHHIEYKIEYKSRSILDISNKFREVSVQIGENEYAVFNKEALKKIDLPGSLEDKAKAVVELIKAARSTAMGSVRDTTSLEMNAPDKKAYYKQLIMEHMETNFGKGLDDATKQSIAESLSELATKNVGSRVFAIAMGIKQRIPANPTPRIIKLTDQGQTEEAQKISREERITKVRVNRQGQIIVSVELPLGEGGSSTVRKEMELNLSTESVRVFAHIRVLKTITPDRTDSSVWLSARAELAHQVGIFRELEKAGFDILDLLHIEPIVDDDNNIKGYEAPIAEGTAEMFVKEIPPPGAKYPRDILLRNIMVAGDYLSFLDKLHSAGYVHQDIKPANILIYTDREGKVNAMVSDFGTVTKQGGKVAQGSPAFQNPERNTQEGADKRSDCYAAGVTLKLLVYGPNAKIDQSDILQDLGNDPIDNVIRGLCDQNPETRLTASQSLENISDIVQNF